MLAHILTAVVAVFLLSAGLGLLIARAMRPTARMQPKPRDRGDR